MGLILSGAQWSTTGQILNPHQNHWISDKKRWAKIMHQNRNLRNRNLRISTPNPIHCHLEVHNPPARWQGPVRGTGQKGAGPGRSETPLPQCSSVHGGRARNEAHQPCRTGALCRWTADGRGAGLEVQPQPQPQLGAWWLCGTARCLLPPYRQAQAVSTCSSALVPKSHMLRLMPQLSHWSPHIFDARTGTHHQSREI